MAVRNLICDTGYSAVAIEDDSEEVEVELGENDQVERSNVIGRHEPRAKRPWTEAEDIQLRNLVSQIGQGLWAAIAAEIPGRSGKQVRERWLNHVSPHVTKRPWSSEEDAMILERHREFGNCWSKIAKLLKGRSDNSVKNRFYTTLKRRLGRAEERGMSSSGTGAVSNSVNGTGSSGVTTGTLSLSGDSGIVKKRRSGKLAQPSEQVEIVEPRCKHTRMWE